MKRRNPLRRTAMKRTAPRPGSGISPDNRMLVAQRDTGHCQRCGLWVANRPSSLHHRLPRGRGGDDRPSGLILLCGHATSPGGCHAQVESDRTQAYDDGFLVRTGETPADVPVLTYRGWRWLTDDGRALTNTEHEGGAA